ncbi:hypothetical protein ACIBI7_53320 [Nonomuraea fuscirosea]
MTTTNTSQPSQACPSKQPTNRAVCVVITVQSNHGEITTSNHELTV